MSVIITSGFLLADKTYPLTHARIGYDSILTTSNISGTTAEDNYPLSAIVNPATYERYTPTSIPATITVDAGAAVEVDYLGIGAHTLGTNGNTVKIESSSDDVTYTKQAEFIPGDDTAIMSLFEEVTARYWKITISNGTAPQIGVVHIGKALAMQRPIYGGHSPLNLSRVTAVRPNMSETGQFLGATEERRGLKTSFSWKNLTASWYRANFDPFVSTNPQVAPFFIAWRPTDFPNEVGYCWATGDISPSNSGQRDLMEVSMSVEAFVDV